MGVDHPERGRLAAQMHQDARQHRMLDDVGRTAGVKGVAIVHRSTTANAVRGVNARRQFDAAGRAAAHRRHHQPVAAAGAAVDLRAIAEAEILGQADPDLAQPPAVAGHRDALARQARDWLLTNASSTSSGVTISGLRARYRARESSPGRAPCARYRNSRAGRGPSRCRACPIHGRSGRGAGIRSSIEETMLRSSRGAGSWQYSGKPRSYCGHRPCTTKE